MINLLLRKCLYSVCHAFQQEYYRRKDFNTESLYQHWKKRIWTKILTWSSWSWLQKMKVLKCNFTCQLKIIFCQNLNNVFWGYTNWLTSGRSFSPFLPNEILGNISIPLVIQGCNKTPMCTQIPICTSWVGLPNENSYSEQSGNSAAPSLTPFSARTLNSNKKKSSSCYLVAIQCLFSVEWWGRRVWELLAKFEQKPFMVAKKLEQGQSRAQRNPEQEHWRKKKIIIILRDHSCSLTGNKIPLPVLFWLVTPRKFHNQALQLCGS